MLAVCAGVVHMTGLLLTDFWFTHGGSAGLSPMTTIWTVFSTGCCSHIVQSSWTVVNMILPSVLATSWIQICWFIFLISTPIFCMALLTSDQILFWTRLLLSGRRKVPRSVWCVNHWRLVNVIWVVLILPQSLHMVPELACNWWRPSIMCTIIHLLFGMRIIIIWVLNVFRWRWLGRLLMASLHDSWRELTSRRGRRLGSASGVLGTVWSVRWFGFLELVSLASVVLWSISAVVGVHNFIIWMWYLRNLISVTITEI